MWRGGRAPPTRSARTSGKEAVEDSYHDLHLGLGQICGVHTTCCLQSQIFLVLLFGAQAMQSAPCLSQNSCAIAFMARPMFLFLLPPALTRVAVQTTGLQMVASVVVLVPWGRPLDPPIHPGPPPAAAHHQRDPHGRRGRKLLRIPTTTQY